jgi:D-aspartate ligase
VPAALVMGPPRYMGPLGVMRSLGALGVPVYGLEHSRPSVSTVSRHCAGTVRVGVDGHPRGCDDQLLDQLVAAGRTLGEGTVLIPGSDAWSVFVAAHHAELREVFALASPRAALVNDLASKQGLHDLAVRHRVPTPAVTVPRTVAEAAGMAPGLTYPVILKPVSSVPGVEVRVVGGPGELLEQLAGMCPCPDRPNLMFQEYIPGTDEDVWIFNGYFDRGSRCLAAFTGQKLRQHPAHRGIASLAVCRENREVIDLTTRFMSRLRYHGIVDIGYRFDRRTGEYKILDVNPRLGGAFRVFVDANGLDVARALYWDLTGVPVPEVMPNEGRRWLHEGADLIAFKAYRRLDGLTGRQWMASLRGVQEGATWSATDPMPFALSMWRLAEETLSARWARAAGRWRARRSPGRSGRLAA